MKISVWYRYYPKSDSYELNHISEDLTKREHPFPVSKNESLQRSWKNYKWKQTHADLIDNKIQNEREPWSQ